MPYYVAVTPLFVEQEECAQVVSKVYFAVFGGVWDCLDVSQELRTLFSSRHHSAPGREKLSGRTLEGAMCNGKPRVSKPAQA
eukprot:3699860-Amphidinium_carterae.1